MSFVVCSSLYEKAIGKSDQIVLEIVIEFLLPKPFFLSLRKVSIVMRSGRDRFILEAVKSNVIKKQSTFSRSFQSMTTNKPALRQHHLMTVRINAIELM